jgi:hypothetical protein
MTQSSNPLKQFFRQPAIYLKLPSGGNHWPEGSLNLPQNGEIPIYPMTAIDEITYRTPDALFNGQSVVSVIQSCVPNILDAWHMPSIDVNSILIAIRIASYGHEMEITTTCPGCDHTEDYTLDMRTVLDKIRYPDFGKKLQQGDLEFIFQPMNYNQQTQSGLAQFEQQKLVTMLPSSDLNEEEKLRQLNAALVRITELTMDVIAESIAAIRTPNAIVTDPAQIVEFLNNCDRRVFNAIRDHVVELRRQSDLEPIHIECSECDHKYEQPMNLDVSSFFEPAS